VKKLGNLQNLLKGRARGFVERVVRQFPDPERIRGDQSNQGALLLSRKERKGNEH